MGRGTDSDVHVILSCFFLSTALNLAVGVIIYISKVNDEVSNRKKPANGEEEEGDSFGYYYGWAFFFAGASFISSMVAAVTNVSLYLRRYSNIKDMMLIIPGLEKRGNVDLSRCITEEEIDPGGSSCGGGGGGGSTSGGVEGRFSSSTSGGFGSFRGLGSMGQNPTIIL